MYLILRSAPPNAKSIIPYNVYNLSRLFAVVGIVLVNIIQLGYDLWFWVNPNSIKNSSPADLTGSTVNMLTFVSICL